MFLLGGTFDGITLNLDKEDYSLISLLCLKLMLFFFFSLLYFFCGWSYAKWNLSLICWIYKCHDIREKIYFQPPPHMFAFHVNDLSEKLQKMICKHEASERASRREGYDCIKLLSTCFLFCIQKCFNQIFCTNIALHVVTSDRWMSSESQNEMVRDSKSKENAS